MQATTVTRELIQSVGDHVYHQGASYAPLSPTKGTRNAEIIYQAIKNMPDNAASPISSFLREKRKQIKRRSAP